MADDITGNNGADQLIGKMASWPKWATEDSINKLSSTISSSNNLISSLINKISADQKNKDTKPPDKAAPTNIDYSKPIISEFQRGINKLDSRLSVTNILLNNILDSSSKRRPGINRPRDAAGRFTSGPATVQTPTVDNTFKHGIEEITTALSGLASAITGIQNNLGKSFGSTTGARSPLGVQDPSRLQQKFTKIERERNETEAEIAALKKAKATASGPLEWNAIRNKLIQTEKTLEELTEEYKKRLDAYKAANNSDPVFAEKPRNKTTETNEKLGGATLIKLLGGAAGGGTTLNMKKPVERFSAMLLESADSLGKFGTSITAIGTAFALLIPIADELYKVWKAGAVNTGHALDKGLEGLTKTALSATVLPKQAGLSMEAWNKLIAKSNGGLAQMDSNVKEAGLSFANGTKDYMEMISKFNYFGASYEEAADDFRRASDLVGRTGLKDKAAVKAAMEMAQEDASTLYKLSVETGDSMTNLRKKFDQVASDNTFRAGYTRLLANGEKEAAKNLKTLSETFAAANDAFSKDLDKELKYATLAGIDPTMLGGAFTKLETMLPEIADTLRATEGMSAEKRNAALAKTSQDILNNQPDKIALLLATKQTELIDYLTDKAKNRKEAPTEAFPDTEGARARAASERLNAAKEKVSGEILNTIDSTGVMNLFTNLANAVSAAVDAFVGLPGPIKLFIEAMAVGIALLGAKRSLAAFRTLARRAVGAGAAAGAVEGTAAKAATSASEGIAESTAAKAATSASEGIAEGAAASGLSEATKKSPIRSLYDKIFNNGKYTPVDILAEKAAAEKAATEAATRATTSGMAESAATSAVKGVAESTAAKTATTSAAESAAATSVTENAATSGLKGLAKKTLKLGGGGAVGALLDTAINELTEVPDLKELRADIIDKYKNGKIPKADAIKAIKDIDDKIAESRGGAATRGAVVGTGAMIGEGLGAAGGAAIGGAIGTAIAPGAGTVAGAGYGGTTGAISGAIGGGMLTDKLLGGISESIGGWLSKKFFGGDESSISKELDAVSPGNIEDKKVETIDDKSKVGQTDVANGVINVANGEINFAKLAGPQAEPGAVPSSAADINEQSKAGQTDVANGEINFAKLAGPQAEPGAVPSVPSMSIRTIDPKDLSPEMADALAKAQSGQTDLGLGNFDPASIVGAQAESIDPNPGTMLTDIFGDMFNSTSLPTAENVNNTASTVVETPSSLTGGGLPQDTIAKNAQETGATISTASTTGNGFNPEAVGNWHDQIIRLQKQANEILMAIANAANSMSNHTSRSSDLLENINNKT